MALQKVRRINGGGVYVPGDDIDTDQIVPARFLKCVTFEGLGEKLFYDLRFDENSHRKDHPLNHPKAEGAKILVSGANFGCGSSREHAPQAIYHFGFRAIVAESFAEIFFGNCTALGIACVTLSRETLGELARFMKDNESACLEIDLEEKTLSLWQSRLGHEKDRPARQISFSMNEKTRQALLEGKWDPLSDLLEGLGLALVLEARLQSA